ncbi:MAG TPA: terpene synthase family protein [Blastocatellia bacterium]|nr:terpene synthase family protein [Blastocatellia bacterium]
MKSETNLRSGAPGQDGPNGVKIVSAQDFLRLEVETPASFELRFPQCWIAQPVQNRYAAAIEHETLAWLASYGIGRSRDEAEKLRKFNCGMYGGYSLPAANYHAALLVTQFITLWLFWDDVQVEEEDGFCIEAVLEALTGGVEPRAPSRYLAAWGDIGRRLRRTQSAAWLGRLESTMREWLENAKFETRMAQAFKQGVACPDFTTFFDCRTISIGMFPTFHLIEFAEGIELDESFHRYETVVALKRLASRLVGMGNDLGSLAKDTSAGWLNLVLVLMKQSSLKIEDAFQRIVDIHNADVEAFDRLALELPSRGAETDALVRGWVQAVRNTVFGFTLWESVAERYQESKAVVGKKALIAPVVIAPVHVRPLAQAA